MPPWGVAQPHRAMGGQAQGAAVFNCREGCSSLVWREAEAHSPMRGGLLLQLRRWPRGSGDWDLAVFW